MRATREDKKEKVMEEEKNHNSRICLHSRNIKVTLVIVSLRVQCWGWKVQDPIASTGLNVGSHGRPPLGPVDTSEGKNRDSQLKGRHGCFCNVNKSVLQTIIAFPYSCPTHNAAGHSAMVQVYTCSVIVQYA